jgi:hypothetical protein
MWYYGVRYANGCDPLDLWNPYTTSSKYVMEFAAKHGNPPIKQIRKIFNDATIARLWEERVLKRAKVVRSDKWLNRNDSMAPPINSFGNLAMRKPENRARAKINNTGSGNPMYGKKQKQLTCSHCGTTAGANTYSRWHGNNCLVINPDAFRPIGKNNPFFGKHHQNIEQKTCLYCDLTLDIRNYTRHHGEKCKSKLTSSVGNTRSGVYNNTEGSI